MINTLLTWAASSVKTLCGFVGGVFGIIAIWGIVILWVFSFYKVNKWLQVEDAGFPQLILWHVWLLGWAGLSKLGSKV